MKFFSKGYSDILPKNIVSGEMMNQFCLGRTLSTPNRNVDDGVAKEIYLAKKHAEIRAMIKEERISAELGNALLLEINDYTKLNGNQTKQGFERGL
ncbi:MAG: hypothetical protein ACO1N3_01415, partial [Gammaproteobacteria bacterium]